MCFMGIAIVVLEDLASFAAASAFSFIRDTASVVLRPYVRKDDVTKVLCNCVLKQSQCMPGWAIFLHTRCDAHAVKAVEIHD
jgi:hypothetical protein